MKDPGKSKQRHQWTIEELEKRAKESFGVQALRPGQRDVIRAVLGKQDVLAVMPTGAGKSLCYQLPTLTLPGTTVVVSPLIALMKDQTDKLHALGFDAAVVNSTIKSGERLDHLDHIRHKETQFIFTTPEQLLDQEFVSALRESAIGLVVIDEAHCISEWGHDFRPSYTMLDGALKALNNPPLLALTATATGQVVADIKQQLGRDSLVTINTGVYRPNLRYEVLQQTNPEQKQETAFQLIGSLEGSGLVYCATIKNVQRLLEYFKRRGLDVGRYHGRMRKSERDEVHDGLMRGQLKVVVATNAFGMGIDKADIRFVIHFDVPRSIDAYYQESGRSGRDGALARCVLLYRLEDKRIQSFFLGGSHEKPEDIERILQALRRIEQQGSPASLKLVRSETGIGRDQGRRDSLDAERRRLDSPGARRAVSFVKCTMGRGGTGEAGASATNKA